jgi:hypothetical protein
LNFERDKWQQIAIYEDSAEVTDIMSKQKARDLQDVVDDLLALVDVYMEKGWLYNTSYTVSKLQEGGVVALRNGLTGFDIIGLPLIPPGEGGIYNSEIICDTSIAILSAGGE